MRKYKHFNNKYRVIKTTLMSLLIASIIATFCFPMKTEATGVKKGTNAVVLDSLLSDRSFVVDALTVGVRKEDKWGGKGFSNNPHMNLYNHIDHYMYEDLINDYESHPELKIVVDLYATKADWEKYPLENLSSALSNTNGFLKLLKDFSQNSGSLESVALKKAYEELGGKYPIEETIKQIQKEANESEEWEGYSLVRLKSMVEGSFAYEEYKDELKNSSDKMDRRVYSILTQQESACRNTSILSRLKYVVESGQGALKMIDGETIKAANINDVILNNIFKTDYKTEAGISLSRDMTAKASFDQWQEICDSLKDISDFIKDTVDLSSADTQKIMIEDYLGLLTYTGICKTENLNAAFDEIEANSKWFKGDYSPTTGEFLMLLNTTPNQRLEEAKKQCNEKFLLHDRTNSFLKTVSGSLSLAKQTLANYYLVDTLVRENESIRGALARTTVQNGAVRDAGYQLAVQKYRTLLDYSSPDANTEILLSVLTTASNKAREKLEKEIADLSKEAARKAFVSVSNDPLSRARIAASVSSVCNVYQVADILDDRVAGLQDVAEKIYEIKYLLKIQEYATAAFYQDVAAYQSEGNPQRANKYAGDAIEDLQFLKQIKLRQIKSAYEALNGMTDSTLSGIIAKIIAGDDGSSLNSVYKKQMEALVQMQVFPVGNEPFVVEYGKTLSITKQSNGEITTYMGVLKEKDRIVGTISEMDLYAHSGIEVEGELDIDSDIRIPQIIGSSGKIKVNRSSEPILGYMDGSITALSDVHFRGSVNGTIYVPDVGDSITVTVDCDLDGGISNSNTKEGSSTNFIIGRDLTVSSLYLSNTTVEVGGNAEVKYILQSWNSDVIVEGDCNITTEEKKSYPGYLGLKNNSTLEVYGSFGYFGRGGYYDYLTHTNRLSKDSQIILHGVSTFDTYDHKIFSIYTRDDEGRGSGIKLAGEGTAKLINVINEEEKETESGRTYIETYPSLKFYRDSTNEKCDLLFASNKILGFENLCGDVVLPRNCEVMGDSNVYIATINAPDKVTYKGNLTLSNDLKGSTASYITKIKSDMSVEGDLKISGQARIQSEVTAKRGVVVDGELFSASTASKAGVIIGDVTVERDGQLYAVKISEDGRSEFYVDGSQASWTSSGESYLISFADKAFAKDDRYGFTINGNLEIKDKAILSADSLDVKGRLSTEESCEIGANRLRVGGFFNCLANTYDTYRFRGIRDLALGDGADLTGLSQRGLETVDKLTLEGDARHAINLNRSIIIDQFTTVSDQRCSLPNGIYFNHMDIDGTLTVEGEVPHFQGKTLYTGKLFFKDKVNDFLIFRSHDDWNKGDPENYINEVFAEKDIYINGGFSLSDPEKADDPKGELKSNGKIVIRNGDSLGIYKKKCDLGNATVKIENDGSFSVYAQELRVRGIEMNNEESYVSLRGEDYYENLSLLVVDGGDLILNGSSGGNHIDKVQIRSNKKQSIIAKSLFVDNLEADLPGLYFDGLVETKNFTTSTENFEIQGDLSRIKFESVDETTRRIAKKIMLKDVYNLEYEPFQSSNYWRADFALNIDNIEETERGNKYNGYVNLQGKTNDVREIGHRKIGDSEDYTVIKYYKIGSLMLPHSVYINGMDVFLTDMYVDQDGLETVRLTEHRVTDDMTLFYSDAPPIPDNPEEISVGEEKEITIGNGQSIETFKFVPEETGNYCFESSGTNDTVGWVIHGKRINQKDDESGKDSNFKIVFYAEEGEVYYLQSKPYYENTAGTYTVKLDIASEDDDEGEDDNIGYGPIPDNAESITLEVEKEINVDTPGSIATFVFTASEEGTYYFESTGNIDTKGCVLRADAMIAEDDDSGSDNNFRVEFTAESGDTFYLQSKLYSQDSLGKYTIRIGKSEGSSQEDEEEIEGFGRIPEDVAVIDEKKEYDVALNDSDTFATFIFTPSVTGEYVFESSGDFDTVGCVVLGKDVIASNDDDPDSDGEQNFRMLFNAESGKTYYLMAKLYNVGTEGLFKVKVSGTNIHSHEWDAGKVSREATTTVEGEKLYTCTVCGATKTEAIPKKEESKSSGGKSNVTPSGNKSVSSGSTPAPGSNPNQKGIDGTHIGEGASAASADKAITTSTSDEGPAGSKFAPLLLRSSKQGKTNIILTWAKVSGAKKYVIYGNACGKKNRMKNLVTVTGKTYNVKKIGKKLKKGTYHKFMIVALDSKNNVVSTSKVIHVATKGNKKNANPTKVTVRKPKTLKKGKTHKLAAKQAGKNVRKHRAIKYETSNVKIASVSSKGVIRAKKKGKCYVYAYAQNGICRKVKVTVK